MRSQSSKLSSKFGALYGTLTYRMHCIFYETRTSVW